MENPFPGMNPYLEDPHIWPSVRFPLVVKLADELNRIMPENYWSGFGRREYKIDATIRQFSPLWIERRLRPEHAAKLSYDAPIEIEAMDEGLAESYVKIYHGFKPGKLVTLIDFVGPLAKRYGTPARRVYLKQQKQRLGRDIHLIEIDLIRAGERTVACPFGRDGEWDYVVCRHLGNGKNHYQLWPFGLQDRMPRIAVPLADKDEVVLDLQPVFDRCYASGRYEMRFDYEKDCEPSLTQENAKWVDELLRKKKLRR